MKIGPRNKWRKTVYQIWAEFPDLKFSLVLHICLGFLFLHTYTYLRLILKAVADAESGLIHYSLWRSYCIFTPWVLWPRSFLIFIVDELKNFATNNLFKLLDLVMYWNSCVERKNCRYNISPIGYWGKGLIVGWYFGIGQRVS